MNDRPAYDQGEKCMLFRERLAAGFSQQILATVRPFITVGDGQLSALDVGCGYGFTAVELAKRCCRVVGIEPCLALYEAANALRESRGLENLEIRHASAADLAERDAYDVAVLDNVLEHIADQPAALAHVSAALKPGGALLIIVPNKLWPLAGKPDRHYRRARRDDRPSAVSHAT